MFTKQCICIHAIYSSSSPVICVKTVEWFELVVRMPFCYFWLFLLHTLVFSGEYEWSFQVLNDTECPLSNLAYKPWGLRSPWVRQSHCFSGKCQTFGQKPAAKNEKQLYLWNKKWNSFRPARWSAQNPGFLARDSIYAIARYMPSPSVWPSVWPSGRPSVCPSHGWISQRRLKLGLRKLHHRVAPWL